MRHIHDFVTNSEEGSRRERFSEEVRQVVRRGHVGHTDFQVLDRFSNEEVPTLDMLDARMMFGVVRDITRTPAVGRI